MSLGARRTQQCSHRFCRAPLPANHFAKILRIYAQLQDGSLRACDGAHLHTFGVLAINSTKSFMAAPEKSGAAGRKLE